MGGPREIFIHTVPSLYKAAEVGDIDAFNEHRSNLNLLLTPNKNTVLHIHIIAQSDTIPESTEFVENILHLCPSLLLQANTKGETSLHLAARYGRSHTVTLFFERAKAFHEREAKQLLTMTNNLKDTALHEAVRFNHLDVVKLLIKEDPHFSYSANYAGETPLYLAAERGFGLVVSEILRTCTTPSHAGPNALTALHASVIRNDHGITREILEVKGADITKEADQQGWTPLHCAAYWGHVEIVELLLNVDISAAYLAADRDGNKTALHIAVGSTGHFDIEKMLDIVKMLISRCPACWELVDNRGWNLFHFAAEINYLLNILLLYLESPPLKKLLNEKDKDGNTPLHLSVASGSMGEHTDYTKFIKDATVDEIAFNNENLNALDIMLANEDYWDPRIWRKTFGVLTASGARVRQRMIARKDNIGKEQKEEDEKKWKKEFVESLMKVKDAQLVVAALIATVTFAAGFTVPGGYISDRGHDQGTPILTRKAAFKAFVISDTLAFTLSISSVFIHFVLALRSLDGGSRIVQDVFENSLISVFLLTIIAMGAMLVAFMTGLYAVLEHSAGTGIAVCFIVSFFFCICIWLVKKIW